MSHKNRTERSNFDNTRRSWNGKMPKDAGDVLIILMLIVMSIIAIPIRIFVWIINLFNGPRY
jgi:hypothetical protein